MSTTEPRHDTGLRKRSIGFWESLALSVEAMGPLLGALAVAPLIALTAGFSAPFMALVCGIAMFIVALTIARFAKVLPGASAIYAYVSHGLGERAGFITAWLSFMYYVLFVPQLLLAFGIFGHSGLDFVFGINVPWWVFSVIGGGLALLISLIGIQLSTRIDLGLAIIADLVLLITSIAIVAKVASAGHLSLSSLTPTHAGGGFTGLSLAVASGVLIFLGFEQSFTLGEEVRDPHGNVPKAIFVALGAVGFVLLFATFAMVEAFGVTGMGDLSSATTSDGTPWWAALSRVGLGTGWRDVMSLTIMVSVLGNIIASHNAVVRIQYGMGRANALPSAFGRTGARRQTPYFAICVQIAVSMVVCLVMGGAWNPTAAFGFLGFTNGLAGAVAFIVILVAAIFFFHRLDRSAGMLRNIAIPAIGIAILLPAVYTAFYPNPGPVLKWAPWAILGWTVLGVIYHEIRSRSGQKVQIDYAFKEIGETTPSGVLAAEFDELPAKPSVTAEHR